MFKLCKMTKEKNKILFICDFGESRSVYFAQQFQKQGYITKAKGLDNSLSVPIMYTVSDLEWADIVVVLSSSWRYDKTDTYLIEKYMKLKPVILHEILDIPEQFKHEFLELKPKLDTV